MSKNPILKFMISVDMEGISGIVSSSQTGRDKVDYEKGRALMVGDVNAAIEGILSLGEAEIVVADGHGNMTNIKPDDLHEKASLVRGRPKPLSQVSGIDDSYDAVLFVGYHSKKGTKHGVLSHTYSGRTIDSLVINGTEIGETALNASVAGYYGVPLVFVSGDLAVTKEALKLDPNIKTVAVKEAVSRTAAKCINPMKARKLIKKGVVTAIENISTIKPFTFSPPIEMQVKFSNALMADAVEFMPSAERIDGRTVKFVLDDYIKAFNAFIASVLIATAVSQ